MLLFKNILFIVTASVFHLILLYLFMSDLYVLYFIALIFFGYILHRYYCYFSNIKFFLFTIFSIVFINSQLYETLYFECLLRYDLVQERIYVDSEVMYILVVVHYLFLISSPVFLKQKSYDL